MKFELFKRNEKVDMIKELIDKLDDLYDELTYDNDEKDTECIKSKIKIRLSILNNLDKI